MFGYKRALFACVAAVSLSAVLASGAQAAISPTLTLNQSAGTTAGTSPYSLGFDLAFNPTGGDSPKDLTTILPAGLLANANLNGGACLVQTGPTPSCQVASGTATMNGTSGMPAAEFLVQAPKAADIAGIALTINGQPFSTADVVLRTSPDVGLNTSFSNLPAGNGLSELNLTLADLRLPSNCPTPQANVTVQADSQNDPTQKTASAPLAVTGCGTLPYSPALAVSITRDSTDNGAELTTSVSQAAGEGASSTIELDAPSSLGYNLATAEPCVTGTPCPIGTASATSPLVPAPALANGTVTLGGTLTSPTLTLSWPAPLAITIVGKATISPANITFSGVPDIPLTGLTLDITGTPKGKAFTTTCAASSFPGKFTAQGGQSRTSTAAVSYNGCPTKPTASGSFSGLAAGHPKLALTAVEGIGSPKIASLSVGPPRGLTFIRSAIVKHTVCTGKGSNKKCTTTIKVRGLSLTGGKAKKVQLKGGRLVITLKNASARVSLSARGPLLLESKTLRTKVKKHKTKALTVNLKVTDAKHLTTGIGLSLKAK